VPVSALRCRVCESEYPALASGVCVRCFVGALRAAARGESGERDRVVALITATGIKTPQVVESEASGSLLEVEPDIEALLSELGVVS
jgi:hypothetical protein